MYSPRDRERRVGLELDVAVSGNDAVGRAFEERTRSVNVSGGGICFRTDRQLTVGSRLELEIALPSGLRRHFGGKALYKARAVVCRVEHFEAEPRFRVGARFLGENTV